MQFSLGHSPLLICLMEDLSMAFFHVWKVLEDCNMLIASWANNNWYLIFNRGLLLMTWISLANKIITSAFHNNWNLSLYHLCLLKCSIIFSKQNVTNVWTNWQHFKARAASLMHQLSPWKSSSAPEDVKSLFEALRTTLLLMKDLDHMVRCCVEAAMPSIKLTKELLILARTAIQNNTGEIA